MFQSLPAFILQVWPVPTYLAAVGIPSFSAIRFSVSFFYLFRSENLTFECTLITL